MATHRATARERAREVAQDLVDYQRRRQQSVDIGKPLAPLTPERRFTDAEAARILAEADAAFNAIPALKSGNRSPQMIITAKDRAQAARIRTEVLNQEPLPPGVDEYEIMRLIDARGPLTKKSLSEMTSRTPRDIQESINCLVECGELVVIGHRKRYGNRIDIYGRPGSPVPSDPVDAEDVEGAVTRYLRLKREARFSEIKAAARAGDAAVMSVLTRLIDNDLVARAGHGGSTVYVWMPLYASERP